jgi:hypothetical protein
MVAGLSAQNTKFNGKWTRDMDKSPMAAAGAAGGGGGRGGTPTPFTLAVDATSLTRTPEAGMNGAAPVATVYKLDGAEHEMPMGQATQKVKAKWDDSKTTIVVEATRDNNGTSSTTKTVYSTEGDWLVITTTAPPRGGTGDPTVTKVYYKKA